MKAKRIKSLVLSLVLILVLVLSASCASMGAEKILERAKEIKEFDFDMTMMLSMSAMGQSMKMEIGANGTMMDDPTKAHMLLYMEMDGGGESGTEEVEMYFEDLGDIYKVYLKEDDAWDVEEVEKDEFGQTYGTITNSVGYSQFLEGVKSVRVVGQEKVASIDALKIECIIPAKTIVDQLMANGGLLNSAMGLGDGDLDEDEVLSMLEGAESVIMNVWVDKNYYPIKYEMDMTGFMQSFLKALLEEMGSEGAMAASFMNIEAYTIEMTLSNINKVSDIKMPKQAA